MGRYFGTDGFRGKAGKVLRVEHAVKTGRFLGQYYREQHPERRPRIVIGKDTRRSSYMYENGLAAGLISQGADVYFMHVTTTPSVSYITRTEKFDCGIMISASHNPYFDNGIKLMNGDGEKMDDALQGMIEDYIDGLIPEFTDVTDDLVGCAYDYSEGREKYAAYLVSVVKADLKGRKIVLDCANGASSMIAPKVFGELGVDITVLSHEPNGLNINTGCGSTHMENILSEVSKGNYEGGFAFDGDADRCLAVDENGELLNGDKIMYICGRYLKDQGMLPGDTVVTTIMSNFGLYKAFDRAGLRYEKTAVGDRYVYENMKANDFMIGGEQSGHVIFRQYARTGDGILTALMMLQVMAVSGKTLSELSKDVTMYPQVLKNVEVDDKTKTLEDPSVKEAVAACTERLGENGRVLLRASGTEPVLRVMAEAGTEAECELNTDAIIEAMRTSGHLVKIR